MTGRQTRKVLLLAVALLLAAPPARAAVVDVTGTSAALTWATASGPVSSYGVFISRNGAAFPSAPDAFVTAPQATVTASAGDLLVVKVAAYDTSGAKGPDSPVSDSLNFVAPPLLAISPATLAATRDPGAEPGGSELHGPERRRRNPELRHQREP